MQLKEVGKWLSLQPGATRRFRRRVGRSPSELEEIMRQLTLSPEEGRRTRSTTDRKRRLLQNLQQTLLRSSRSSRKQAKRLQTRKSTKKQSSSKKSKSKSKSKPFDVRAATNWVQLYMNNADYDIVDNEGGGNCFFASLRDGLSTIGKNVTVAELREKLSSAATREQFQEYRTVYRQAKLQRDVAREEIKELRKTLGRSAANTDIYQQLEIQKENADELLKEFKWVEKLDTFDKFVAGLKKCSYWADDWAVSVIEKVLNIKVILLSEYAYENGDINNIINCGRADDELLARNVFRPSEYIVLIHTGGHYKLVTYKGKGAFKFNELPRDLVNRVKSKCMERDAGLYSLIPEFVN